ncbi:addiction module protein [Coraliomargarita sp. W4R53]
MIAAEQIKQLTSKEKLMAIEAIWVELLSSGESVEPPSWHIEALKETEARVSAGLEEPLDWEQAKVKLRAEFE